MTSSQPVSVVAVRSALARTGCTGTTRLCASDVRCDAIRPLPTYCLKYFQEKVRQGKWSLFNRRRAEDELEDLKWSPQDLQDMLLGMKGGYQKTFKNATVNDLPGYRSIDADQYIVYWNEEKKVALSSERGASVSLSLKIAIKEDEPDDVSGVVTFHISN
jgi:hypothetical protein